MKNKCVFILVYFGKFNNYFPFFLNSCENNPNYSWIIFTDQKIDYSLPINCRVINMDLDMFNKLASSKLAIEINIKTPYKLCDFKPAFGFLFEEYIKNYEYWGHCDCDLIFGNLDSFLPKIFDEKYDKIFAAGHLTIYKNNFENNRMFMKKIDNNFDYNEVYQSQRIFVFDEDYNTNDNYRKNIHTIFMKYEKKIFLEDFSLNLKTKSAKIINVNYDASIRNFKEKKYVKRKYYWENGKLFSLNNDEKVEYIYAHFQMRKMRICNKNDKFKIVEILPDRFIMRKAVKLRINFFDKLIIGFPYLYWVDYYCDKIRKKIKIMKGQ